MRLGWAGVSFSIAALLVANLAAGKQGGIASFAGYGRPISWLITLALCVAILALAGHAVRKRWDGVFIDDRNKMSLSRLQLVLWTVLLVSALMTAGLSNVSLGYPTPLQISVPPSVWALLGIGSFTFVAAPAILSQKSVGAAPARLPQIADVLKHADHLVGSIASRGLVVIKNDAADARWLDVLRGDMDDADYVDVGKLQQLFFTVLLLMVYTSSLYAKMDGTVPISEFPKIDEGFVALLGLSHATYLAHKAAPKPT